MFMGEFLEPPQYLKPDLPETALQPTITLRSPQIQLAKRLPGRLIHVPYYKVCFPGVRYWGWWIFGSHVANSCKLPI